MGKAGAQGASQSSRKASASQSASRARADNAGWALGFGCLGSVFKVRASRFGLWHSGFKVRCLRLRLRVRFAGFVLQGSGLRVRALGLRC